MEKIENGQNIIKTIEPDIPKNLAKDFEWDEPRGREIW